MDIMKNSTIFLQIHLYLVFPFRLGFGNIVSPVYSLTLTSGFQNVISIACGVSFTLFANGEEQVFGMGYNNYGQQ